MSNLRARRRIASGGRKISTFKVNFKQTNNDDDDDDDDNNNSNNNNNNNDSRGGAVRISELQFDPYFLNAVCRYMPTAISKTAFQSLRLTFHL